MTPPIRLRVLGLPRTYGDCCAGTDTRTGTLEQRLNGRKQCEVLECRNNLSKLLPEDVQGRRHNGRAPEWTVTSEDDASKPSCAIDVGNQRPGRGFLCGEIAEMTGLTKRRIQQLVRQAVKRLD